MSAEIVIANFLRVAGQDLEGAGAQVEADIAKVQEALSQSTAHFGVDLGKPNEPAATPGPIRS